MSDGVTIRPFAPPDQDAARRLILAGLADHFGAVDESMNPDLDDIDRHYLRPGHRFVLAEHNDILLGTGALVEASPDTGRLVRISVALPHRGQGIGRALVHHLIAEARSRGYRRLVVETNHDWSAAIALYHSCGFTEYDRHSGDVHMILDLH
jgi:GNAT superfamily N-acetyltransferase